MSDKQKRGTTPTRRSILKLAGGGITGTVAASIPVAAESRHVESRDGGVVAYEVRDPGNPLTRDDLIALREDSNETYSREQGESTSPGLGVPSFLEDDDFGSKRLVSYAFKVNPNGTSRFHAESVYDNPSENDLEIAHRDTEAFTESEMEEEESTNTASSNYSYVDGGTYSTTNCPLGRLHVSPTVYEWEGPDDSRVLFLTRSDNGPTPGGNLSNCEDSCGEYYNRITHNSYIDYSVSDLDGPDRSTHEPSGSHDGTQETSFSISTDGASIGWSYTQPNVSRIDNSGVTYQDLYAEYSFGPAEESTDVYEMGCECEFDRYQDPGFLDQIMRSAIVHEFLSAGCYDSGTMSAGMNIYYEV